MISLQFRKRWELLKAKTLGSIVQECPPELMACEVCGVLRCDDRKWLDCERRLAVVRNSKLNPTGPGQKVPDDADCKMETPSGDR